MAGTSQPCQKSPMLDVGIVCNHEPWMLVVWATLLPARPGSLLSMGCSLLPGSCGKLQERFLAWQLGLSLQLQLMHRGPQPSLIRAPTFLCICHWRLMAVGASFAWHLPEDHVLSGCINGQQCAEWEWMRVQDCLKIQSKDHKWLTNNKGFLHKEFATLQQ